MGTDTLADTVTRHFCAQCFKPFVSGDSPVGWRSFEGLNVNVHPQCLGEMRRDTYEKGWKAATGGGHEIGPMVPRDHPDWQTAVYLQMMIYAMELRQRFGEACVREMDPMVSTFVNNINQRVAPDSRMTPEQCAAIAGKLADYLRGGPSVEIPDAFQELVAEIRGGQVIRPMRDPRHAARLIREARQRLPGVTMTTAVKTIKEALLIEAYVNDEELADISFWILQANGRYEYWESARQRALKMGMEAAGGGDGASPPWDPDSDDMEGTKTWIQAHMAEHPGLPMILACRDQEHAERIASVLEGEEHTVIALYVQGENGRWMRHLSPEGLRSYMDAMLASLEESERARGVEP